MSTFSLDRVSEWVKPKVMQTNELLKRITLNPKVCFGKPTIRNKRYTAELIIELLSAGMSHEDILADYPDLEKEDIFACLLFAKKLFEMKSIEAILAA